MKKAKIRLIGAKRHEWWVFWLTLLGVCCAFAWVVKAQGVQTWTLQAQLGGPAGVLSIGSAGPRNGVLPSLAGWQNANIPDGVTLIQMVGTVTVKVPDSELLLQVMADGSAIWTGEIKTIDEPVTLPLVFPIPASWQIKQVWINWQFINGTTYNTSNGAGFEYQLTFQGQ